jgi:adenylosuccinate lyase
MIEKLVVYPEMMQRNLDALGGLVHSQRVLLALTQAGVSREDAYRIVQTLAMATWREGGSFKDRLSADDTVRAHLQPAQIDALFDLAHHFRQVDAIFRRVLPARRKRRPSVKP